jgi:hypothetical protein
MLREPLGCGVVYSIQWYESKVDLSELAKLRFEDDWSTEELASKYKRDLSGRFYYRLN